MLRLDWFLGAPDHWRERAFMQAEALRKTRVGEASKLASDRVQRARAGSFERRHWRYVSKVLAEG